MFRRFNQNPLGKNVGDCTVRAISNATGQTWEEAYINLCAQGLKDCDMPSANATWGNYLRSIGFRRHIIPDTCSDCVTVADFAREYPRGRYILALSGHVICVADGDYIDAWDSGNEPVLYFWKKETT